MGRALSQRPRRFARLNKAVARLAGGVCALSDSVLRPTICRASVRPHEPSNPARLKARSVPELPHPLRAARNPLFFNE
jgi:hypothetical protein